MDGLFSRKLNPTNATREIRDRRVNWQQISHNKIYSTKKGVHSVKSCSFAMCTIVKVDKMQAEPFVFVSLFN